MNQRRSATVSKGLDVFGAVEELHNLSAKEMNKLLRDSQHLFTLRIRTGRGSYIRVNLERLVSRLPLHLLACLASRGTEPRLRYLLRGVRLLHSLSDLALRHPKLEQVFLHEVKIREQVLDLIIYMLITLAGPEQEGRHGSSFTILHAALVACSLHLLPAFVAGEWSDLVPVLLVHPKVDIFMDVAFDAVRRDIGLLQIKLRGLNSKLMSNRVSTTVAESMAEVIAQQCEASVQVLQSLCQPQAFRDKVLNHKELCKNGGLLRLALAVLKLQVPILLAESKYLVALVNRLKSKILLLMVKFCETESVSFLDEVAADVATMQLAEVVASEVLALVRNALVEEPQEFQESEDEDDDVPSGLLYIHAMRLADIFSDDSNFRNLVMDYIAPDLAKVLAQSPTAFLSRWCGSSGTDEIKSGSDSVLIYDPFKAAGAAMHSFKSSGGSSTRISGSNNALLPDESSGCSLSAGQLQFASYSQERSALFVKILANLHCFNPEICPADEKDRFLDLFVDCLVVGPFTPGNSAFFLSTVQTAVRVCENLFLLLDHVSSLSSEAVSDEDLQLVSTFYYSLHDAICPSTASEDSMQEDPVVAYVKDAHEQKRKNLLAQWQKSERWKRINLSEPSDDKEQSNGGSSTNKATSHSSSSQPAIDERDTNNNGFSEETQSFGEKTLPKRKREEVEEDLQARKKEHSTKPWEIDGLKLNDCGPQMLTKPDEMNRVTDLDSSRNCPVKEINACQDVLMNDTIQTIRSEHGTELNVSGKGWNPIDLKMYLNTNAIKIGTHIDGTTDLHSNSIKMDVDTNRKGSENEAEDVPSNTVDGKNMGLEEITLKVGSRVTERPADDLKVQSQFIGMEPDKTGSRGRIQGDKSLQEQMGAPNEREDTGLCQRDIRDPSDAVCSNEMQKDFDEYKHKISKDSKSLEINKLEEHYGKKETTSFNGGSLRQTNTTECVINMNADTAVEGDCGEFATGFKASEEDAGVHAHNEDASTVVEMKCDMYSAGNLTHAHGSSTADDLPIKMKNEDREPIKFGVVRNGISECIDGEVKGITGIDKISDCNDRTIAIEFKAKGQNAERFCTQQNMEFKSKVDDPANRDNDAVRSQVLSYQSRVGDQRQGSPYTDYSQNISHSSIEAAHITIPESLTMCSAEKFKVSVPSTSQVYSAEESLSYPADASRVCPSEMSRVYPILEANNHMVGGCTSQNRMFLGQNEDLQPRKRKRNIMSPDQMALMEGALRAEPYMRRHPDLILQWTVKLNKIGPEISYQQLKNWLNNRKARLARQRGGEVSDMRLYGHDASAPGSSTCSGSSNDPNRSTSEDGANTRDSGSTLQTKHLSSMGIPQCKLATEDMDAIMDIDINSVSRPNSSVDINFNRGFMESDGYGDRAFDAPELDLVSGASRRSAPGPVKFVKCEAGQFVSLLDREGREAATGTLYQVEGVWQGKRIDEHGICIVRIVQLNVDKTTRLPHPSVLTGNTFEEAERLCGQMIVAWDTKRIFLIS